MTEQTEPQLSLLRRAAEVGPGYRGSRRETSSAERRALARLLEERGATAPTYLANTPEWVDRRAKLFEAGDYPDKGVSVSIEDLDRLTAGFDLPVPVLIEHAETPLEIGFLTAVERKGSELFGNVALTAEAHSLVERSGARKLSLGLSPDLGAIREVSLVRNPRIDSAQLFSGDLVASEPQTIDFRAAYERLLKEQTEAAAEREVRELIREGRILPAQGAEARKLLGTNETVLFDDKQVPVRELFRSFLTKSPRRDFTKPTAPVGSPDQDAALMVPEEAEFYRRYFPGVSLKEIARVR